MRFYLAGRRFYLHAAASCVLRSSCVLLPLYPRPIQAYCHPSSVVYAATYVGGVLVTLHACLAGYADTWVVPCLLFLLSDPHGSRGVCARFAVLTFPVRMFRPSDVPTPIVHAHRPWPAVVFGIKSRPSCSRDLSSSDTTVRPRFPRSPVSYLCRLAHSRATLSLVGKRT